MRLDTAIVNVEIGNVGSLLSLVWDPGFDQAEMHVSLCIPS